ncbi:MAG: exopolysaccharide biosynthesis protein [Candidatus Saccharibacteria bacterium]|nr:exopolysaccharide biosynthesis protein [Candidatus Saccharibacteria bacterium]
MTKHDTPKAFSDQLDGWVKGNQLKNLQTLIDLFEDKSFAVVMLLLMLIPALPIPTGGVTHVFEVVVALLALEQIAGLKAIWLPRSLTKKVKLEKIMKGKLVVAMMNRVRWLEKRSSPRWTGFFKLPLVERAIGLVVLGLTVTAFLSPPFSGLDTLPSLGVVIVSLAVILEDVVMLLAGIVVGALGVVLSVGFGAVVVKAVQSLF